MKKLQNIRTIETFRGATYQAQWKTSIKQKYVYLSIDIIASPYRLNDNFMLQFLRKYKEYRDELPKREKRKIALHPYAGADGVGLYVLRDDYWSRGHTWWQGFLLVMLSDDKNISFKK